MTDPVTTPDQSADGTEFPYAQDHEAVWHRRPADDTWSVVPEEHSCSTICGKQIVSAHVSPSHPLSVGNYSYTENDVCPECDRLDADAPARPGEQS